MAGRAGRAGLDTLGEAIMLARKDNAPKLSKLMREGAEPISSCLEEGAAFGMPFI